MLAVQKLLSNDVGHPLRKKKQGYRRLKLLKPLPENGIVGFSAMVEKQQKES